MCICVRANTLSVDHSKTVTRLLETVRRACAPRFSAWRVNVRRPPVQSTPLTILASVGHYTESNYYTIFHRLACVHQQVSRAHSLDYSHTHTHTHRARVHHRVCLASRLAWIAGTIVTHTHTRKDRQRAHQRQTGQKTEGRHDVGLMPPDATGPKPRRCGLVLGAALVPVAP